MINQKSQKKNRRELSDTEKNIGENAIGYFNDKTSTTRPPDEFYKFLDMSRNTRTRLIITNKDLFIIWGQNGLIASFFSLAYLLVWGLKIGTSKK